MKWRRVICLLTGSSRDHCAKHIQEAPAPITDYDATLPAALDKIVRKALSKQKQQRYARH